MSCVAPGGKYIYIYIYKNWKLSNKFSEPFFSSLTQAGDNGVSRNVVLALTPVSENTERVVHICDLYTVSVLTKLKWNAVFIST
jgi:hypothetical protein